MKNKSLLAGILIIPALLIGSSAEASHSWSNFHWARTSNPFTLNISENMTSSWDPYIATAASDWSLSSVLDLNLLHGSANPKTCKAVYGRVELCNSKYGNNGWLGIATVWTSGGHIVQGTVKMNDTYFFTSRYNTPAWKQMVLCQEIGHTFGLDHQDEDFNNANLDTCMDYTSDPSSNQHPNDHDYAMLEEIYAHLDPTGILSSASGQKGQYGAEIDHDDQSTWGRSIRTSSDGKSSVYVKETRNGKVFTFVVWAE